MPMNLGDRDEAMWKEYCTGKPMHQVAKEYNLSKQRVSKVFKTKKFKVRRSVGLKPKTFETAMNLYFQIERHYALGGDGLSVRDIRQMLGRSSTASARWYLEILRRWQLVDWMPFGVRTIHLMPKPNYPPVEWREDHAHE